MKIVKNTAFALVLSSLLIACNGKTSNKMKNDNNPTDSAKTVLAQGGDMFMLVGTYTSPAASKGIYVYKFNTDSGRADSVSMAEVENSSFLTLSADEQHVYSVSENGEGNSMAYAFSFDKKTGTLQLINFQNTKGSSPCYIETDAKGKMVVTANYGGGSVSVFETEKNGGLSPIKWYFEYMGSGADTVRQKSSHVHSVRFTPDGKYLFATDLGTDKVYRYAATGTVFEGQPLLSADDMEEIVVPAGTGARHLDFHPNGKYMYLLGELSGQVLVYDYDNGALTQKQTIAADTVGARGSADIHVSPDGRFVYASNRLQADGLAVFSVNQKDGTLTEVGYQLTGRHPRNFAITPNGKFLLVASRDDNKIQVFVIDSQTGLLTDTHQDILLSKPVCIKFAKM